MMQAKRTIGLLGSVLLLTVAAGCSDPLATSSSQSAGQDVRSTVVTDPVTIKGPSVISAPGTYTWKANPAVEDETTTYTWEFRPQGDGWSTVGEGSSYSRTFSGPAGPFDLRLTVNSGQTTTSVVRSVEFEM